MNRGGGFLRIYKRNHFVECVGGMGLMRLLVSLSSFLAPPRIFEPVELCERLAQLVPALHGSATVGLSLLLTQKIDLE
jgi:hypothetical protein